MVCGRNFHCDLADGVAVLCRAAGPGGRQGVGRHHKAGVVRQAPRHAGVTAAIDHSLAFQ